MIPCNLRNIKILLFLFFCFKLALTINASDFLFTSINTSQGLSDNQIRYILQLPDGRMVFTTSGNVNLYDGVHFTDLHRTVDNVYPLKQYDGYYRIYQSGDSLLWIKDTHRLMGIHLHKEQYIADLDSYFRDRNVNEPIEDIFVDSSGYTWLLTSKEIIQLETDFRLTIPNADRRKCLQDLNIEKDELFLFYHTGEVVCYSMTNKKRMYSITAYPLSEQEDFQRTSLVIKSKNGFYQLRNGRKGGLFHFDWRHRRWEKLFEQNYTLNTLIVTPQSEKAYISCVHGFWIIDLTKSGTQQYIPILKTKEGQLVSTEISTIFQDLQGGLWIGTLNRGILYHHPAMHKLTYVGRSSFPVSPEEDLIVEAFAEDKEGNIFLKVHSNIFQLSVSKENSPVLKPIIASSISNELANQLNRKSENKYFRDKPHTALYSDTRGWVWAGTADGLELFASDRQNPRILYREDGLSNNFVQAIIEDKYGDIWVTTSNGISRIHIHPKSKDISFTNYNQQDGALEGEYMKGSAFKASDGTLYFGGIDGFNIFHPDREPATPGLPYSPIFTALRLYGEKVNTGMIYGNRIILPRTTPYTTNIELNYNQNFLTFEFSALNYVNCERTYYRYQLEGVDKQWMNAFANGQGNTTVGNGILQASYTNLPPGNYTLKVMASDNPLQWDKKITRLQLTIHAPWWKTTTAYVLYIIVLLIAAVTSIRLYVYWTRKEMERRHKEEILLLRIRNLIEQCNHYEAEQQARSKEKNGSPGINEMSSYDLLSDYHSIDSQSSSDHSNNYQKQNLADSAFLAQAIELVEKHLHVNSYSVEQLSRDLCMERTGLYRKLVTILDQSPSLFIRNIRLQRAAQLLIEGHLSVTEIAERTGFSSSSYLSKCFQEIYGCRPSEYAEKTKKST